MDTTTNGSNGHTAKGKDLSGGVNVGSIERWASAVGGGALAVYGIARRDKSGLALAAAGGVLLYRGVTGHCPAYGALGVSTGDGILHNPDATVGHGEGIKVEKQVTINKSPEELYRFWRNFENLPHFMKHLESVAVQDDKRSHWVAKAPAGRTVEWDAEVINEVENELIAWRSLEGADVANAGSVRFEPAPGGRGTIVRVVLEYKPPMGKLAVPLAKLFGEEPGVQVDDDLRRFKQVMETGEIATTSGQPTNGETER